VLVECASMQVPLSVALILLASPCGGFCQDRGKPVRAERLRDGRLVVPDFSFSVSFPNPDAHWSYMALPDVRGDKATAFIVETSGKKYSVGVWDRRSDGLRS
jgi:hypothetical protein